VQCATIWPKTPPTKLLCAFVLSRLDYCSSRLAGCPKYLLSKLQKLKNNATKLIFKTTGSSHVTPMLHSLHWLPNEQRIDCNLSLLSFKIICHQAIIYLSDILHLYTPSPQLRSPTDTRVFRTPSFRAKYNGHRSFSYQVPVICNQLLLSVRHSTSVSSFKTSVKTFLLKEPPKTTTFIQFHCPALRSSVCVCVHACVRACVRACVCDVLTFENMYM